MTSKSQKERAQKVIPGGTKKRGELRKVSKWYQKAKKKDRKKLSPEAREKKESSAKSLNDIKKSKRKSTWDFHFFFRRNVPGTFPSTLPGRILCKIETFSGFAAIFLTANALYSPVRKENPASRACGKNNLCGIAVKSSVASQAQHFLVAAWHW